MTEKDFDDAKATLLAAGFTVEQAEYSEKSFGSWFVILNTTPRVRVVWDGKDRWFLVEVEMTDRDSATWAVVSTLRAADEQTVSRVVRGVRDVLGRPT